MIDKNVCKEDEKKKETSCCCTKPDDSKNISNSKNPKYWKGYVDTPIGKVPLVGSTLTFADTLGRWKARWGIGRMRYMIEPGLYAVGNPSADSVVFVSANYKMSFDKLREELEGIDAWIMVLDTKGINVWCAAGKGTFGTEEIINRIEKVQLNKVVSHRKIILPQLGAPGVKAYEVKERSGFRVVYGPIRSKDIKLFLESGNKATADMRLVSFDLKERAVLIPVEFTTSLKYILPVALFFFIRGGFADGGFSLLQMVTTGSFHVLQFFLIIFSMFALNPILLPWLPGKALAVKGVWTGLMIVFLQELYSWANNGMMDNWLKAFATLLIIPAVSSFIAMNFTGATTYTSISGVKKEMRIAVPMQIVSFVIGIGMMVVEIFL